LSVDFLAIIIAAMNQFLVYAVTGLLGILLWFLIVSLAVRPFDLHLPLLSSPKRRRNLNQFQHILVLGVLICGLGCALITTLWEYLDWRYWNGPSSNLATGRVLFHAVFWAAGGVLFGWMTWNQSDTGHSSKDRSSSTTR
jgi:hypothetical protein